jgi:hypothetical protein
MKKKLLVILIGLWSGWVLVEIARSFFGSADERMSLPIAAQVFVFLTGGAASAWWAGRNTFSVNHVVFRGFALGAAEWVGQIVSTLVHHRRWVVAATNAAATKTETGHTAMTPQIASSLEMMTSIFMLGVCVAGLLATWRTRGRAAPAPAATPAEQAGSASSPGGPSIRVIQGLLVAEIILLSLVAVLIVTVRVIREPLFALLGAIVVLPILAAQVWVSIAGAVKGIQLLKTRTHRNLAVTTISVSAVPFFLGAIAIVASLHDSLQMQARMKEREQQYSKIESFFQKPRRLEAIRVDGEQAEFIFDGGVSIPIKTPNYPGVAGFCEGYWVGQELRFQPPEQGRDEYVRRGGELIDSPISGYIARMGWDDKCVGQARVDTAARIVVGLHSADPKRPEEYEVARVAAVLRPFADTDRSGFLDSNEGGALYDTIDFGVKAAKLVGYGFKDHSRIAHDTRVSVDDLEKKAQMYNELASRIQVAGCGELPYLELPPDDRSATALHIPTHRR